MLKNVINPIIRIEEHIECDNKFVSSISNGFFLGVLFFFVLFLGSNCTGEFPSDVTLKSLRCEYTTNPLGIDVTAPRLNWVLVSSERGQKQTAYQILVANSEEKLNADEGDIWDTGKVISEQSIHVIYSGDKLESRKRYYWKVRVWDKDESVSNYSDTAIWEMGLLEEDDWNAKWISYPANGDTSLDVKPAPMLRTSFTVTKPIKKARAYITGLGYYVFYMNGEKVGDHVLDPIITHYDRRVLYVTYDITNQLKRGDNAVGVILGTGWYNMHSHTRWYFDSAPWRARPTLLCQLEIEFTDGSVEKIVTDNTWKAATGPIVFDGIRNGETYDARLEKPGWNNTDYDDSSWLDSEVVEGPTGRLVAQMVPPIKVMQTIIPVKVWEKEPGVYIFDMGQNMAGWTELNVSGAAGTEVKIKYAGTLTGANTFDGSISYMVIEFQPERDFQTDRYILKGEGIEVWEPEFVYHGFQYVQITGFPGIPTINNLKGRVIHSSFPRTGHFECSNELINQIQHNILWSYTNNFVGIPTDCPNREKMGWTGDAQIAAEAGLYNFDSGSSYSRWMNDFKNEQQESGRIPTIIPNSGRYGYKRPPTPAWGGAYVLIPWYLYQYYGDTRILEEHYEGMKGYVNYMSTLAYNNIFPFTTGLGDWCPAETSTPVEVTSTAYYYNFSVIISKVAQLLGKNNDVEKYKELAEKIKDAFNKTFFDSTTGQYSVGSQTALSTALFHDLVSNEDKEVVLNNLLENLKENQWHIDTGILGLKYVMNTLTDNNFAEIAYRMATQKTFPSYGYQIELGATTLWENWDPERGTHNHIMFGAIGELFYKALAGINTDPNAPGFKNTIIHPHPVDDLSWVDADYQSMYGTIKSSWRKENGKFTLDITIPANTTSTVFVPVASNEMISENGNPIEEAEGVTFLYNENDSAVFSVGSGNYRFIVEGKADY
ncbi:glycoside hydrolase family 78 protein [Candidatus Latescibacterota bacterium]